MIVSVSVGSVSVSTGSVIGSVSVVTVTVISSTSVISVPVNVSVTLSVVGILKLHIPRRDCA